MHTFADLDDVRRHLGTELGPSEWWTITQDQIDAFAAATGDDQWIHVDPVAAAASPLGTTIAHGYLTLSLIPMLTRQVMDIATQASRLNYGLNRVRFPAMVPSGSRVRLWLTVSDASDVPLGTQLLLDYRIELEGSAKPACVAQQVVIVLG